MQGAQAQHQIAAIDSDNFAIRKEHREYVERSALRIRPVAAGRGNRSVS